MLKRFRSRLHGEDGFTLIELLVVILIIGILAAIAIPSFLNQKSKGQDASTKSAARTAQTALETWATDNNGSYSCGTSAECVTALEGVEPALANVSGQTIGVLDAGGAGTGPGASSYRISVTANSRTFYINKASTGAVTRTCTPVNSGGCPSSGTW